MPWLYRYGRPLVWLCCKLFWRLKIVYLAPLAENKALVLASNHIHALDALALAMITPRQVHFMSKKEVASKPGLLSWIIKSVGSYPIDREGNDVKAMRHTLKLLKEKRVIGIYPESTRSRDGQVHQFLPGAAMFAMRAGADLIPVGFYGTFKLFRKSVLVVGEKIDLSAYEDMRLSTEHYQAVTTLLQARVVELAAQAKRMAKGEA